MTFENHCVSVRWRTTAPPTLLWIATLELTDNMTCEGPVAIVQSGGIQPVAAMPAKLVDAVGAADGSSDVSIAARATPVPETSDFAPESAEAFAGTFRTFAFCADSFNVRKRSSGIG